MSDRTETDPQVEADLLALLQGRLDPGRTLALADHLRKWPERSAELLADAGHAAELQLALASSDEPPPPRLLAGARRLQYRLRGQRLLRRCAPFAAAIAVFAAGWTTHVAWQAAASSGAPPLVEAALDAQAALELRHWMESQPESTELNTQEIVAALGIELPSLPAEWIVRDVQIVATPERPAVAIAIESPDLGPLLLMAVARSHREGEDPGRAFHYKGQTIAMFDRNRSSFVLIDGSGHPEQLAGATDSLLANMD